MAERTHEETEQTAGSAGEESEASANGDAEPSGTLGTGVALTIGGAVVGALLALLHGRRSSESNGADAGRDTRLADDLVARASAAARGDEGTGEHDEHDEDDETSDERDAEAVGVAQGADAESAANGDRNGDSASEHEDSGPRADAPEHEATEEADSETAAPSATREERDADRGAEDEHETRAADSAGTEEEPDGDAGSTREQDGHARGGGGALAAARAAARQLGELTGRTPESVLGVERRDGSWHVTLEVVEVARTPPTTDVLGSYEVELDGDGELVEYHQVSRYVRGRAAEGG